LELPKKLSIFGRKLKITTRDPFLRYIKPFPAATPQRGLRRIIMILIYFFISLLQVPTTVNIHDTSWVGRVALPTRSEEAIERIEV
jgi:hypothetical protein